MRFNNQKLVLGSLGALGVLGGMVAKNSQDQYPALGLPDMLGPALFVGGWGLVAYTNALNMNNRIAFDQKSILGVLATVAIAGSSMRMRTLKEQGQAVGTMYPSLYTGGWAVLAYALCRRHGMSVFRIPTQTRCALSFGAAVLALTSTMAVLPKQRAMQIVDGPGMVMLTTGWALVVAALAYAGKK